MCKKKPVKCVCVLRPAIFALVFIDDEANLEISTTFRNCSKEEMCEGRVKLSKKLRCDENSFDERWIGMKLSKICYKKIHL